MEAAEPIPGTDPFGLCERRGQQRTDSGVLTGSDDGPAGRYCSGQDGAADHDGEPGHCVQDIEDLAPDGEHRNRYREYDAGPTPARAAAQPRSTAPAIISRMPAPTTAKISAAPYTSLLMARVTACCPSR